MVVHFDMQAFVTHSSPLTTIFYAVVITLQKAHSIKHLLLVGGGGVRGAVPAWHLACFFFLVNLFLQTIH